MISRTRTYYDGETIISTVEINYSWEQVRQFRDAELVRTDYWALKDLTMSQAKKDYRIFLRDLPQNYESANAACDAWNEYDIPE